MAGIFKNLDASDIKLTPFRSHKKWSSIVCYNDYYSNVLANPESIGLLQNQTTRVYASDASSSRILKLDQSDSYTIIADETINNLSGSFYGEDYSRGYVASYSDASGLGVLTMRDNNLQISATGEYTSSKVTNILDVSYAVSQSSTSSYMVVAGYEGITGKEFDTTNGGFIGTEYTTNGFDPNHTSSIVGINAEGKLHNDRIIALSSSGSLGVFAISLSGSYNDPLDVFASSSVSPGSAYGYAMYGVSPYGVTTPAILKTLLYCQTQDLYFALFEDSYLYRIEPNAVSQLITSGVSEILQDKSNFVSGSLTYQPSKIHVVYTSGQVGLDLQAVGTAYNVASYDKVVDARQWVSRKPIVKATIQQNLSPATIGIFAGTTSSLQESVFFTINPDTHEIGNPCHYGATKGDLRIGVANQADGDVDVFIGYDSIYSNRFFELQVKEPVFQLYKADYNPTPSHPSYNPLNTLFDQGSPTFDRYEARTYDGKFQRVVHKSLNHLFYESFYSNTKAVFGSGNINNQVRILEDQALIIDLPQSKFGESIQPQSIQIEANYNISGSSNNALTITDDLFGNLYVSGGLVSPIDSTTLTSSSVEITPAGEWPTKDLYKYNGKGLTSFTSSFNQGNWQMQTVYKDVTFTDITGSEMPIPSPIDLLGVVPVFSEAASSSIHISPNIVADYRQSYNFENSDFSISFMIRPTEASSHPAGSIVIAKSGKGEDYGVDLNGNILNYSENSKSPYRVSMSSSFELLFERDDLFEVAVVSGSLTQNQLHHVIVQKSGSSIYMYVDNVLTGTSDDIQIPSGCSNKSDIYIGNSRGLDRGFDGLIDNLKIYPSALVSADRSILYHTLGRGTTKVGNAFYTQGMLVLSSITSRYMDIQRTTARGTHTIWEKELTCTAGAGEFNRTFNPTVQVYNPQTNQYEFKPFTTGSDFKPYVTTIGLYDDHGQMLAVAKLGFPIKLPSNVDTTFIVRYDK